MTRQKRWTMLAVVLGSGIVFLDSTVVNVALPKIGEELQSSLFGKSNNQLGNTFGRRSQLGLRFEF